MWAYEYSDRIALESLRLTERSDPDPGPHDVVIRMRAVALNHRDVALARGRYHISVEPPLIPLSDGAGEIIQIGTAVTRFRVGDLAAPVYLPDWLDGPVTPFAGRRRLGGPTDGTLCELKCMAEDEAVRLPSFLSAAEAATLPVTGVTSWHALNVTGTLRAGDSVLIQGAGALSLAALQIAKMAGARGIMLTRGDRRTSELRALGADAVIPRGGGAGWEDEVVDATRGEGADMSFDILGGEFLNRSVHATRVGGTVHAAGYVAGTTASLDLFQAIRRAVTIRVATAGHRASFEALARALELHRVRPVVGETYALAELPKAFEKMSVSGHFGKIVIDVTSGP